MFIYIDKKRLSVTPPSDRNIHLVLKSIAKHQKWGYLYDSGRKTVHLSTAKTKYTTRQADCLSDDTHLCLSGVSICIDPGHGGTDFGAIGPSGSMEKDNTLAISLLLRDKLEASGATVIMTREIDQDVAPMPDEEELQSRVDIANNANAAVFISIHNDAFINQARGTTSFHFGDKQSLTLAKHLQGSLVSSLGTYDRGHRFASFDVLRNTDMPSVLVETAFISNPEEEKLLGSPEGREAIAQAIFSGIINYYQV